MTNLMDRPQQVDAAQLEGIERRNRILSIAVVTLAIGLLALGAWAIYDLATEPSDPTSSAEYVALEQELARTDDLLAELTAEREMLTAEEEAAASRYDKVTANETAHIEAFLAKDLDALMDTYTEDAIWVDETYGDYMEGKVAIRDMLSNVIKFTDPDASGVLDRFISEDGTRAASTWEWTGTNFFGKSFDLPFALIDEHRDGKIAKQTIYYASPDAHSQLMGS